MTCAVQYIYIYIYKLLLGKTLNINLHEMNSNYTKNYQNISIDKKVENK